MTRSPVVLPSFVPLLVALLGPPALVMLGKALFGDQPSLAIDFVLELVFIGLAVFILFVVTRVERKPLAWIGLRKPTAMTFVTAGALILVSVYVFPLLSDPLVELLGTEGRDAGVQRLAALPMWYRMVLALAGGAVEEILYRGYAIEKLGAMTGRRWRGAVIATIVFALVHVPMWGWAFALSADLPAGVVLAIAYVWRRDLVANIIAHCGGLVIAMWAI